ncbi:MAG TPA: hypothetical protein VL984_04880 [Acidimicrobiales bacterium]|nr:hypothetical protein [Acidimicrobiales bacterium]
MTGKEDNDQEQVPRKERPGLTREEDDELRRLAFMARFGALDHELNKRIAELRSRDRRKEIRNPRSPNEPEETTPEALHRVIPPSQRPRDEGPSSASDIVGPGSPTP